MPLRGGDYNVTNYINESEERMEARLAAIEERLAAIESRSKTADKPKAVPPEEAKESEVKQTGPASSKESRSEVKEQSPPEKSRRW